MQEKQHTETQNQLTCKDTHNETNVNSFKASLRNFLMKIVLVWG